MTDTQLQCKICDSRRLRAKPFGYVFHNTWLGGMECRDCGIIFIHPQPTPEDLNQLYSSEYFEGDFRCGHAGSYFDEENLSRLADRSVLERIGTYKPSGRFLEVGCAGGAFLNAAREAGYDVTGVEYSADATAFAQQRFHLHVIRGDLAGAGFPDASFEVVFLGDVLEHLTDPVSTLHEVHRVLGPGGLLVIHCPMQTNTLFSRAGFLVYSMLGKQATVRLPPYHLFEYRPGSLHHLLHTCGFDITGYHEGLISPKDVTLRGSALQRLGKKIFQYPNAWITSAFGRYGDRVEVFATRRAEKF